MAKNSLPLDVTLPLIIPPPPPSLKPEFCAWTCEHCLGVENYSAVCDYCNREK